MFKTDTRPEGGWLFVAALTLNDLSPYIRRALDSVIYTPWILKERVIFDYELLFIKEGEVLITVENERYEGRAGDIFLFKPGQRHSIRITGGQRFYQPHLHFDLIYRPDSPEVLISFSPLEQIPSEQRHWFRQDLLSSGPMALPNKLEVRNKAHFERMLFEIIEEYQLKGPYGELVVKGLFLKLLAYLLREEYQLRNPVEPHSMAEMDQVREYLLDCLDREVQLDELALRFNRSKFDLSKLYVKAFGIPPIRYHRLMRMEKIKEYIQYTNQPFAAIAERFGFSSIHAFSRAFRNREGVAPSYYRRQT